MTSGTNQFVWREYGLAVGATVAAWLMRSALDPLLGGHLPYVTFFVAVAATTYYAGLGPSLTAVALGGIAADWFFVPPLQAFSLTGVPQPIGHVTYLMVTLTFVGFGQAWRRTKLHAEAANDGLRREVADRKRIEEALRAQKDQLRLITDTAPVYIAHCDQEGRYRFVNRNYAERFGVRPEDCAGKRITDLVGMAADEEYRSHIDSALAGNRVEFEVEVPAGGSRPRWLYCIYVPELSPDGSINGLVAAISDITTRKEVERALRESEERLRSFAGQLEQLVQERTEELVQSQAHLRSLASELNLTEQRERKQLATELHDHLAQMLVLGKLKLSQAKHLPGVAPKLLDLIGQADDVLTQSLAYTRTLVAELAPPVLRDFGLPVALKWLAEQLAQHEMTVTIRVPDEDVKLPEDQAVLLFQSVRELLLNVAKHAKSAEATVSLVRQHGYLRIEVQDHGVGFHAADGDSPATVKSSKFGLFSIRERMRALGGRFEMESAPGRGTRATLTLPLSTTMPSDGVPGTGDGRAHPLPPPAEETSEERATGRMNGKTMPMAGESASLVPFAAGAPQATRVLLVDDHAMVRQGLRSLLDSYADIEVVGEARNGEEAVAGVERWRPAVVVMDINMPTMNGIEATAVIKARYPQTTVIGLSVNAKGDNQKAMAAAGAAMLLTKEAAVDHLYEAIRKVLVMSDAEPKLRAEQGTEPR